MVKEQSIEVCSQSMTIFRRILVDTEIGVYYLLTPTA